MRKGGRICPRQENSKNGGRQTNASYLLSSTFSTGWVLWLDSTPNLCCPKERLSQKHLRPPLPTRRRDSPRSCLKLCFASSVSSTQCSSHITTEHSRDHITWVTHRLRASWSLPPVGIPGSPFPLPHTTLVVQKPLPPLLSSRHSTAQMPGYAGSESLKMGCQMES